MEEFVFVDVLAECASLGCRNEGRVFDVAAPVNADDVFRVYCVLCGSLMSVTVK